MLGFVRVYVLLITLSVAKVKESFIQSLTTSLGNFRMSGTGDNSPVQLVCDICVFMCVYLQVNFYQGAVR